MPKPARAAFGKDHSEQIVQNALKKRRHFRATSTASGPRTALEACHGTSPRHPASQLHRAAPTPVSQGAALASYSTPPPPRLNGIAEGAAWRIRCWRGRRSGGCRRSAAGAKHFEFTVENLP